MRKHYHFKKIIVFTDKSEFLVRGNSRGFQRIMPYLDPAFRHEANEVIVVGPTLSSSKTSDLRVRRSWRVLLARVRHTSNLSIVSAFNRFHQKKGSPRHS